MRVLVVEDERHVAGLFLDTLAQLGHRPHVVPSAEAALDRLASDRPDAIILDVDLPGMSGLDFLQLRPIKESGVPILAVSGLATDSQARECLRLGAFDFVPKPVSLDRLREVLMYIQDHAANRVLVKEGLRERRRAARVAIETPVTIVDDGGTEWVGTSVDISPFGIRVRSDAETGGASTVTLVFTPPDDGPSIRTRALVVRHLQGYGFYFVNLSDEDFRRLTVLVQRLLVH
jgi:CheY-like chemotaxis protein